MTTYPFNTEKLVEICRANDISMVGIFGSMAHGDNTAKSDIDLVVKFAKRTVFLRWYV